jgi:hypothetical protein
MIMTIPDGVLLIAGYVLAHAAYSVSDLQSGELLIPLAVTQTGEEQEVVRFEAETQEEAIANAKLELEKLKASVDIYAFAREGSMKLEDGKEIDVITIDAWEKGLKHKVSVIQPYKPNNGNNEFKIMPGTMVVVDGETLEPEIENRFIEIVEEGITYHPIGASWSGWKQ